MNDKNTTTEILDDISTLTFDEIDAILIEDIENYLWTLDDMKRDIFMSRCRFNQPTKTLKELAEKYNLSTSRIQQLDGKLCGGFRRAKRKISINATWSHFNENHGGRYFEDLLPNLNKCFPYGGFYNFLVCFFGLEREVVNEIYQKKEKEQYTSVNNKFINQVFCYLPSPVSLEVIASRFSNDYSEVVDYIEKLHKQGDVEITEKGILPKNLSLKEAVAHVLISHPAGLPWKDISRIVNKKGYSQIPLNEEKMNSSVFSGSEYVYLCGKGTYRHLDFIDFEQFNISEIMQHLLDYFEQRKLNALHLHDYYQQNKSIHSQIEYFTLRYFVSEHSEEYGIFFNGKSGADSISIDKNAKRITQADVIISMLNESAVALAIHEIAERLRSKSVNHATFYLNSLMDEGRVVRVDKTFYTTLEKAFRNIDVSAVMQIIGDIIDVGKIVEADIFREYVNTKLDLSYSKYIYAALVRTKLNELGWYRSGTLFSKTSIPYKSLADMYDQLCDTNLLNSENIQNVQKVAWLTDAVAANALQWWKFQRNQANDNLVGEIE